MIVVFAVLFGRGKLIFFVAVLFLTAGCVFQWAPAQETAGQNEPPAVGWIGDLRARSGDLLSPAARLAEGQDGREQDEGQEKFGPGKENGQQPKEGGKEPTKEREKGKEKEGGQELSFPQGSGAGGVSPERAAIEQTYLARLRSVAGAYEEKINALYVRAGQELSSLPPGDTQKKGGRDGAVLRCRPGFGKRVRQHHLPGAGCF